jgi:hypothetical protein
MVTAEEIEARSALIGESAELAGLRDRLADAAKPLLARMPEVPSVKALLSRDGGVCADDGAPLRFDPWSPDAHRCSRCGREHRGERHHRHWARFQHLWLAERAGHLAALGALDGNGPAAERAAEILRAYRSYPEYPNSDNVLGPARLFFSTYLESIWTTNYLAAAQMLREAGMLDDATAEVVDGVADGAAALIGEFDEGFSNRQTWHNAALAAVAVWFEDADLAERAIEGQTGLLAHLAHGFAADGTWHEGENYHLFALQGLITGIRWARGAAVDPLADAALAGRLAEALRAPMLSALPDRTFPARKDSRFGVSLAQPMYLDLWERGLGMLAGRDGADLTGLHDWLRALYADAAPAAALFDSCLHEAGRDAPARRTRADLPWTALLEMAAELAPEHDGLHSESVLLASQGLAVLRTGERYASLECGPWSGGHGHPDRLHLTLHAGGVHWLPDPGTGSYLERNLFWYRSTLAHNAPRFDGASQTGGDAVCEAFDLAEGWSWVRGRWDGISRTVVSGPAYLLDVLQLGVESEVLLELPWHLPDGIEVTSSGRWEPASLDDGEFVQRVERFVPDAATPITLGGEVAGVPFAMIMAFEGDLLRATAPGTPGSSTPAPFYVQRARGSGLIFASVVSTGEILRGLVVQGGSVAVETSRDTDTHSALTDGWEIVSTERRIKLGGLRPKPAVFEPLVTRTRRLVERAMAPFNAEPPALDGSLDGFDDSHPIALDHEDQYRRSEEPFAGPEAFSATAWLNWDADRLYLAVHVAKPDVWFRPADARPLELDNEADDIHSDGLQVYLSDEGGAWGVLVVPEPGGAVRVRPIEGGAAASEVHGSWQPLDDGYRVTLALEPGWWTQASLSGELGFDLIVNEMRPGRVRRAGQLVWSGGGGWVWLRGDRQDPAHFGRLDLT